MGTAAAPRQISHLSWSRWFHCESSFELSLVPNAPGLFAVGRREEGGRQLTVVQVEAAEDLFQALSRLFRTHSSWRSYLEKGNCVLRYATAPDAQIRRVALADLQGWLATRSEVRSPAVEDFLRSDESHPLREESD